MKSFFVVSLGCPKNQVDTEVMVGLLEKQAGMRLCQDPEAADLLLVNTCGFIQPAVEEAIDAILSMAEFKTADPAKRLVVTGCLVQRYGGQLIRELPEVDLFLGTEEVERVASHLAGLDQLPAGSPSRLLAGEERFLMRASLPRRLTTPAHRAYLKITEGCRNRCSYCLIPSIRGPLRSRTLDDLLAEAQRLERNGVQELTLVGQDLTAYGHDLGPTGPGLADLLAALLAATSIPWLRLLYLYPTRVDQRLLGMIAAEPRIVPYLDIPLQHVSDRVLRAMNRPYGCAEARTLVERIRRELPDAAIRTTFMVGFPGETEEDVAELARFMRAYPLERVGIFAYANEEGSVASRLPGQIAEEEKQARRDRLMRLQAGISQVGNQRLVGRLEPVLVEGVSQESDLLLEGRTRFQAPEIDGCVYIVAGRCRPGQIVTARITEAHPYDLVAEVVEQEEGELENG